MQDIHAIRFLGAAGGMLSGPHGGLIVTVMGAVAMGCLFGVLAFLIRDRAEQDRRTWADFRRTAQRRGLSAEEQYLARTIAKLSGAKDPRLIFTAETAFNRGLGALAEGDPGRRRGANGAHNVCPTCVHLSSLREKLGFRVPAIPAKTPAIKLGHLAEGARLSVLRQRSPERFEVTVAGQRNNDSELLVAPERPLKPHIGESWVLRYPQGGTIWEFDAWTVGSSNGHVVLKPGGDVRWINRRRFLRAPARKAAFVAPFPSTRADRQLAPPQFTPATVTEIGGPGLRLEGQVNARPGQEVLVVLQLRPDKVVEGLGVARRSHPGDANKTILAVELVGLNTSEVADLAGETIRAAVLAPAEPAKTNQPNPPGGRAVSLTPAGSGPPDPQALRERAG